MRRWIVVSQSFKKKKKLYHSNNYKNIKYVWAQRKGVFTPTRAHSPRSKDWRAAYVPQKHLSCCRFLRVLISATGPAPLPSFFSAHQTTGNFPDARLGRNLCILDKVCQIKRRLGYCRCQCQHQRFQRCLRWICIGRCIERGHANELRHGREYAQSYSTVKTMPRSCKVMRKLRWTNLSV